MSLYFQYISMELVQNLANAAKVNFRQLYLYSEIFIYFKAALQ